MDPIIQIRGLSKVFEGAEGRISALENVDLTVEKGDIYGIIGLSGAGKSTLVRCINLLERPTAGTVVVNGVEMNRLKKRELLAARRSIGMIFQNYNLLEQRTALKNVCFPLEIRKMKRDAAERRARELLEIVGLSERANAYPAELSGGQKQRVALARALAADPQVLLCDEATSALDPNTTDAILALLKEINGKMGVTVVVITHEMKVVEKICNKVAVIDNSRIVEDGPTSEIFINPRSETARKLILHTGDAPDTTGGEKLRLIFDGTSSEEPVISLLALNCGITANILYANTKDVGGRIYGEMVVRVPADGASVGKAERFLAGKGVIVKEES